MACPPGRGVPPPEAWGIIRLTEMVDVVTTSPAFEKQWALFYRFLYLRGYGFSATGTSIGIATVLPRLLA